MTRAYDLHEKVYATVGVIGIIFLLILAFEWGTQMITGWEKNLKQPVEKFNPEGTYRWK